ncbi:MAG TPA: YdeI/OmpD-associated family protein [Vicingaceae bacterium]
MNEVPKNSFCPSNKDEWREWLEKNHKKEESIWLIFYKKKSANFNLSWSQAVDEAICFGWIDSVKKSLDEERYIQYFTKRKPTSIWSKINKNKVKTLTKQGLMSDAGLKCVRIAKENGSWTILDTVEKLIIPEDLERKFQQYPNSKDYFQSLSVVIRKRLLYWVISAKKKDTREKRIGEIAEMAGKKLLPKNFR